MPHVTINPDGSICYRTKLMDASQAAAFARCLSANASRFTAVHLCDGRAQNGRRFVEFRPVNPEKQADLYEQQWNRNEARADTEGADFLYWQDTDHQYRQWVFNPASGETYAIDHGECQCPQQQYRCSRAALHCKHMIEQDRRLAAGTFPMPVDSKKSPAPTGKPGDFIKQNADLDFA